jgi:transposase
MKPYSIDFREKIVKAYEQGDTSVRKVAARFDVSKAFVQKLLKQQSLEGHVRPKKQGGGFKGTLDGCESELLKMVEQYADATLSEYCEYWAELHTQWVSRSTMCRGLQKARLMREKRPYAALKRPGREFNNYGVNTRSK